MEKNGVTVPENYGNREALVKGSLVGGATLAAGMGAVGAGMVKDLPVAVSNAGIAAILIAIPAAVAVGMKVRHDAKERYVQEHPPLPQLEAGSLEPKGMMQGKQLALSHNR
jgi:hypothetical protein